MMYLGWSRREHKKCLHCRSRCLKDWQRL